MQLQKLRLHPFAGIAERTCEFVPGINVVLGPNEAGKSTMVNGILCALFESTSFGKVHWRKKLEQFVPRGGGDTFGVTLNFLVDGAPYQIQKSWGGESRSELTLPSGQVVRNADDVDQQVAGLLQLKRGTWQNVLIAHQSAISSTLKEFNTDSEEASDLAHILRSSAFDTDGVSIEKLEASINEQLTAVSSRWDMAAERPEQDKGKEKGIENPWKRGVGRVLEEWYQRERLKNEILQVEDYERNLDAINQKVTHLNTERANLQLYVDQFKPIVAGLKARQGLEFKLDVVKKKETSLREIQSKWPTHESDISRLKESLEDLDHEHGTLREELKHAHSYRDAASKREKLKAAKEANEKLGKAEEHYAKFKELSPELFRDLKTAINERERHAASMAAGKLQVRFIPESNTNVDIRAGLEDPRSALVSKDQPLQAEADGVFSLTTDHFRFEVESGDGQFSAIQASYEAAKTRIEELLSIIGVTSIEDANKREQTFSTAKTQCENATAALQTILGGQTLPELEKACAGDVSAPKRGVGEVNEAVLSNRASHNRDHGVLEAKRADIKLWQDKYENQDSLLDHLLDARNERQKYEKELSELPPLPEGTDNVEQLESEFNTKHGRLTEIKEEELPDAKNQQATLNATEPDRTTQELADLIEESEARFRLEKRRLDSLIRLKDVFQKMKDRMDSGTLDPWMKKLSQTIQQVTSDRYAELDFDDGGVTRSSGIVIPHDLLSMGTKASMGFSIRLSMAAHFLEDLDGFLILDDPMVDLDADRQKKTADILREFAEQKQVILLTCHDAHAALLTESPLRLTRNDDR